MLPLRLWGADHEKRSNKERTSSLSIRAPPPNSTELRALWSKSLDFLKKKPSFILSVFEDVKPILPNTMLIFFYIYLGTRNFSETFSFRKTKTFLIIVKWRGSAVWWEWSNFGQSRELRVTTRWYVYYLSGRLERNSFWWGPIFFFFGIAPVFQEKFS